MKARIKFRSYPMSRCGAMTSQTAREHRTMNSRQATCVVVSEKLKNLTGEVFTTAANAAIIAEGFIIGGERA
jgi:hypothetical protein